MEQLLQKAGGWLTHPLYDKGTMGEWALGIAFFFLVFFAWRQVIGLMKD